MNDLLDLQHLFPFLLLRIVLVLPHYLTSCVDELVNDLFINVFHYDDQDTSKSKKLQKYVSVANAFLGSSGQLIFNLWILQTSINNRNPTIPQYVSVVASAIIIM